MKKKKLLIIVVVILVLLVLLVQCGSDSSEGARNLTETNEKRTATEEKLADEEDTEVATTQETVSQNKTSYSSKEEVEAYKASCQPAKFAYNDILRYEDNFKGKNYYFSVRVAQIMDNRGIRAVFDDDYNDIMIEDARSYDTVKILPDDELTIYAEYAGTVRVTRSMTETTEEIPCFIMYAADVAGVTDTEFYGTDVNNLDYVELYGGMVSELEGGSYILYDLNGDGYKELIIGNGTEADWMNRVYSVNEIGAVADIGGFYGNLIYYVAEDGDGLYGVYGHGDNVTFYRIHMNNGEVCSEELSPDEMPEDEYYSDDNYIEYCETPDLSLLEKK